MKGTNGELKSGDGRGYVDRIDCWSPSSHRLQMSGLTKSGSVAIVWVLAGFRASRALI
jgi:hypothetical protein